MSVYPAEEKAEGNLPNVYKSLKGRGKEDILFLPTNKTRGNKHKLKHGRLCLNIKNHFNM